MLNLTFFYSRFVVVALAFFVGCTPILRQPDFSVPLGERERQEVNYDVTLIPVDHLAVKRANETPFVLYVNSFDSRTQQNSIVSEARLFDGKKPTANEKPIYQIGVGDVVEVIEYGNLGVSSGVLASSQIGTTHIVSENGSINLQNGMPVKIAGLSLEQASATISSANEGIGHEADSKYLSRFPTDRPGSYRLGSGDVLSIERSLLRTDENGDVSTNTERLTSTVGPDGVVSILGLGDIEVVGLTLPQVRERVFQEVVRSGSGLDVLIGVDRFESKFATVFGAFGTKTVPISDLPLKFSRLISSFAPNIDQFTDYSVRLSRSGKSYEMSARDIVTGKHGDDFYVLHNDVVQIVAYTGEAKAHVIVKSFAARSVSYVRMTLNPILGAPLATTIPIDIKGLDLRRLLIQQRVDVNRDNDLLVRLNRGDKEYRFSAQSLVLDNPSKKYWLQPNDQVIVEDIAYAGDKALLLGELQIPTRLTVSRHQRSTLSQALFAGGAFSDADADFKHIYVLRGEGQSYDAYHFDATQVLKLSLAEKFELRPGDIVFVRSRPITRYNRTLALALTLLARTEAITNRL